MNRPPEGAYIGKALRPAVSIATEYSAAVVRELKLFAAEIREAMAALFEQHDMAMDAKPGTDAKTAIETLLDRWQPRFNALAQRTTKRMMTRTERNANVTLGMSLKEVSEIFAIDLTASNARLQDVIQASTMEAAQLIKRIPAEYLSEVQGAVMRSITTGAGMKDLVPFLTKKYDGNVRWARHVAMDQTRKAYSAITRTKLQRAGVESYIWIHTGGSAHPRKEHIALSGQEFRYDDPPVIDKKTGQRGNTGDLYFCRCVSKPVFRIKQDEQDAA
jgi:SPP1 gp7 family putative phage head morphogenesis protein